MTLRDIQQALAACESAPTKQLGQNFLHDQNLARWIVDHLEVGPGDHVVEVGPGLGALTEFLVQTGCRLTLLEKDTRLVPYLTEKFGGPRVRVVGGDALDFDLRDLWGSGPVKVIGNLPYYVSTPLIEKFTSPMSPASRVLITLQLELAQRLGASPGTSEYGAMTVCVSRRWQPQLLKKLPASVFYPAPKVDSAVLLLTRREAAAVRPLDDVAFDRMVRRGFSERRKQLKNLLPELRDQWGEAMRELGHPETVRAEKLSLSDWESLVARAVSASAQKGEEIFDIVDAEDRVIGSDTRERVHVNNLTHRAVHMVVLNDSGEVFLQRRSMWKDKNPSRWDSSAAGHVDSGETYEQAADREFFEELGASAPRWEMIGRLTPGPTTGWEFINIFVGQHNGPFHPAPLEVETGAFFPLPQVREWARNHPQDFSPVFLSVLPFLEGHIAR